MHTINITQTEAGTRVRILRWPQTGRYPVQVADLELEAREGESTLAMLSRCGYAVGNACEQLRAEPHPDF